MDNLDAGPILPTPDPAPTGAFTPVAVPPVPHTTVAVPEPRAPLTTPPRRGAWRGALLFVAVFLVVTLTLVFTIPLLHARWLVLDGQARAEVLYAQRRAELRAEADEAERLLDVLDRRVNLVSLGFRAVVQKVTPHVVNVTSFSDQPPARHEKMPPNYFDRETRRDYWSVGVGSGVIVKPGYVLTNFHVIRGATRLRVTFASGQGIAFDVAGHAFSDRPMDLAVLCLPEPPACLRPDYDITTEFADSDRDVDRGDLVLAIGSPLGLKQTVTHGIISAKGRLLDRITRAELLQTDAAINPGSSGGALFNQYGKLVGVNVAIASESGRNEGIGFAIPSNTARAIFDKLATLGELPRGYIGVALKNLPRERARQLGLLKRNVGGVEIMEVQPDQPAQQAGIKPGDIIVGFDNELLDADNPSQQLTQWLLEKSPGQQVTLEVLRGDQRRQVTLHVGRRPDKID